MRPATEILLNILHFLGFEDRFTAYNDLSEESLLEFWNVRRVSRQFRDCIEDVVAREYVKKLILRINIVEWKVIEYCPNPAAGVWFWKADIAPQFTRWSNGTHDVVLKVQDIIKSDYLLEGFTDDLDASISHALKRLMIDKDKWNGRPGIDIWYRGSSSFHSSRDYLVQGIESVPDLLLNLENGQCSFNWKSLLAKHCRNRRVMNTWKSKWVSHRCT